MMEIIISLTENDGVDVLLQAPHMVDLCCCGFQNHIWPSMEVKRLSCDRMPRTLTMLLFVSEVYIPSAEVVGDLEIFFVSLSREGFYFKKAASIH